MQNSSTAKACLPCPPRISNTKNNAWRVPRCLINLHEMNEWIALLSDANLLMERKHVGFQSFLKGTERGTQ
jgi:hypothetical protein